MAAYGLELIQVSSHGRAWTPDETFCTDYLLRGVSDALFSVDTFTTNGLHEVCRQQAERHKAQEAILRDLVEPISILRDQEILIKQLAPSYRLLTYAQRDRPGIELLFLCKDYNLAAKRQYAFDDLVHVHRERHLLLISLDNHIKPKNTVSSYGCFVRRLAGLRPWFWYDSHAPISMSLHALLLA